MNICKEFVSAESDLDLKKDIHFVSTERTTHKDKPAEVKSEKLLVTGKWMTVKFQASV
jgi:hypothetical protein